MKSLYILLVTVFFPISAMAQDRVPLVVMEAHGVTMAEFLWIKRPVVVFADSPNDPAFVRQIELLAEDAAALAERDVVVIVDTKADPISFFRQKLRPRGFSLVLLDKDGEVEIRKPRPWDAREITRAIDKFPLARQEVLEKYPSGR
jgi:hypothetical protein